MSDLAASAVPLSQGWVHRVEPLVFDVKDGNEMRAITLWLHHRAKRTCWYFKALYEYEAFVTTGPDPASPRYKVDKIDLHIQRNVDGANYTHSCSSTDYCAKSDEVVATFGACGKTCLSATATYGSPWSTIPSCID